METVLEKELLRAADRAARRRRMTEAKDRVGRRVGQVGDARMRDVCRALGFSLGCGE